MYGHSDIVLRGSISDWMPRSSNRQRTKGKLSTDGITISLANTTKSRLLGYLRSHGSTFVAKVVVPDKPAELLRTLFYHQVSYQKLTT